MTDHGSCYSRKYMEEMSGDNGYCKYPLPAWVRLALGHEENKMPIRYAPCNCYEYDENFDDLAESGAQARPGTDVSEWRCPACGAAPITPSPLRIHTDQGWLP